MPSYTAEAKEEQQVVDWKSLRQREGKNIRVD
jgi:hypothetical protein